MTETLLYLVYGNAPTYQLELGYSVLSAVARMGSRRPNIVLMTDDAGRRPDLPVEHLIFSATDLARWTDYGRHNHACKVHAYLVALRHFGGKVAMIDTDTWFLGDPMSLFDRVKPGRAVMHDEEGMLGNFADWGSAICHSDEHRLDISPESVMFNSGVVACEGSMLEGLEEVPAYLDALLAAGAPFNAEQFAFSHILLRGGEVVTCSNLLRHYWGFERRFIHARIAQLMPERTEAAFQNALAKFDTSVTGYPDLPLITRVRSKLRGQQRKQQGGLYSFAYLCYLGAFMEVRSDFADAWASTALDVITVGGFAPELVKRDFVRLAPSRATKLLWLKADTRNRWFDYWSH